ncbi:hypothetical protein LTR62_007658 [Meristemomyces frigidus]|uniref:Chromosome segregation in meiosis protein n=1 Tax=Meristemomyces frigidus TaxID=1508187 RepID=A0AAN7TAK8_9PEZI|nr:hypothetical protein LTR62_007658 [Meristemomyces frigidus]
MPSAVSPNPRVGGTEPNYDQDVDDFLRDLPIDRNETQTNIDLNTKDVDEEIKIRKPRKPVPKLDENLLLGDRGIIALRRHARRLKFKGKGHEFSDIGRLLGMYQLWSDDMFPKAKFRDGIKMIENLGRGKRMGVMRRSWMDGTKARARESSMERVGNADAPGGSLGSGEHGDGGLAAQAGAHNDNAGAADDIPGDDELDDLMAGHHQQKKQPKNGGSMFEEDEDEDDLDALMAENDFAEPAPELVSKRATKVGPFEVDQNGPDEDELDALLAEEALGPAKNSEPARTQPTEVNSVEHGNFDDEEEAIADMGW